MEFKQATSKYQLLQILQLQANNLRSVLASEVVEKEGFVTVEHDLELLSSMNDRCGHIIAMEGRELAGYALCMHPEFRNKIPVIRAMFEKIDTYFPDPGQYMVMGQVCVAPDYRGKGVFRGLYEHMKKCLYPEYLQIITEVDSRNQRSLNAHLAIGFRELEVYEGSGRTWHLIALGTAPD